MPVNSSSPPPRTSRLAWALAAAAIAFSLGLIGSPWFEGQVRSRFAGQSAAPDPADLAARVAALEARASRVGPAPADLAQRLARLETRLAAPSARAADPLDRARETIAAGTPADVLDALQAAYGPSEDVAAAAALAARPVSAAGLRARLAGLSAGPAERPPSAASWADRARARLQSLVTVRRAADARSDTFIADADAALAADDPAAAIAAVLRLPASAARAAWLADGRRLADGRAAIARLAARPPAAAPPAPAGGDPVSPPADTPMPPADPAAPQEAEI